MNQAKFIETKLEHVDLELTNYCNLSCWMCPRKYMKREVGYISMDVLKKIADELGEIKIKSMNLHLFGESILHPDLREILECLKKYNPNVWLSFSTNATFLNTKSFDKIAHVLDNLFISVDGITPESHSKHRIRGDFLHILNNITEILKYRNLLNIRVPRFEIRMIDMQQSPEEKEGFFNFTFWKEWLLPNDSLSIKPLESFGGSIKELAYLKKERCVFLHKRVAIMWNGDVTTCCYDCNGKNIMGNINQKSLQDIFFSHEYNRLRKLYITGELQKQKELLCHTCLIENYSF